MAGGAIGEHMKSLLLVLVKSHNLVFSVEDILKKQTNKTGIKTTLIFVGLKKFKQVNKHNKK